MGAKAAVGGGVGAVAGVGGVVAGGWPAVAALALPAAAALVLLVWVLADSGRTRRLTDLIRATRTPGPSAVSVNSPDGPQQPSTR